jgi:hypothetical protein
MRESRTSGSVGGWGGIGLENPPDATSAYPTGGFVLRPSKNVLRNAARGLPLPGAAHSDLFSLGIMLAELLSGVHPFAPQGLANENVYTLVRKIVADEPVSLGILAPWAPHNVTEVIERGGKGPGAPIRQRRRAPRCARRGTRTT